MNIEEFKEWVSDKTNNGYLLYEKMVEQDDISFLPQGIQFITDDSSYDINSYGYDDSTISLVFKLSDGKLVSVYGRRSSYNGLDIYGVKEVQRKEVVKVIYE